MCKYKIAQLCDLLNLRRSYAVYRSGGAPISADERTSEFGGRASPLDLLDEDRRLDRFGLYPPRSIDRHSRPPNVSAFALAKPVRRTVDRLEPQGMPRSRHAVLPSNGSCTHLPLNKDAPLGGRDTTLRARTDEHFARFDVILDVRWKSKTWRYGARSWRSPTLSRRFKAIMCSTKSGRVRLQGSAMPGSKNNSRSAASESPTTPTFRASWSICCGAIMSR